MTTTTATSVKVVIQKEPVVFWQLLAGLATLIQLLAIPVAPWLHIVILVLSWVGSTLAGRQGTVPAGLPGKLRAQLKVLTK
jgi:hypothetical protein